MKAVRYAKILLLLIVSTTVNAGATDPSAAFAALAASESTDAKAWYQLAGSARAAGDTGIASRALLKAEELGYAPVRVKLERARVAIVDNNPQTAIAELRGIADSDFSVVQVIVNDPLISSLAGNAAYEDLLAAMSIQAFPCEHQEKFREFDFWIGDWEVRTSDGQLAGHNTVRVEERGCVITEHWTSATGGTGMSINYLDKTSDKWVQVWMAESGSQIIMSGGLTDGGMSLAGTLHEVSSSSTVPFRGLWTPLRDGRVRQFFEQSNDDGETWVPWFEGFYTRVTGK